MCFDDVRYKQPHFKVWLLSVMPLLCVTLGLTNSLSIIYIYIYIRRISSLYLTQLSPLFTLYNVNYLIKNLLAWMWSFSSLLLQVILSLLTFSSDHQRDGSAQNNSTFVSEQHFIRYGKFLTCLVDNHSVKSYLYIENLAKLNTIHVNWRTGEKHT